MTPLVLLLGCDPIVNETVPDSESDTDTDSDSDTDTDSDADTDTPSTGDTGETVDCTPNTVFPEDDGQADYIFDGTSQSEAGTSVALVDVDGDGADELLIGGPAAETMPGTRGGFVWVLYGPPSGSGALSTVADAWFGGEGKNGTRVRGLGDLDGDGIEDMGSLAESCCGSNDLGKVHLGYGDAQRAAGGDSIETWAASLTGSNMEQYLGQGLTGVGDLDHDGYDEVAFGAVDYGLYNMGRVFVLPGSVNRASGDVDESTLPYIDGQINDELCYQDCIVADDFDGDGERDLVIAVDGQNTGFVYLRYGDGTLPAESTADYPRLTHPSYGLFGTATAAVGDVDGDGYPDLAVGDTTNSEAASSAGRVWVVRGGSVRWTESAPLADATWLTIEGVQSGGALGEAILGLGDVDCDGTDDFAVSAPFADGGQPNSGVVGLWLGATGGISRLSNATARIDGGVGGEGFGASLAHGDYDGDGEPDLVVGSPSYGSGAGRVYVFMGAF
jgi:hypothetical protein